MPNIEHSKIQSSPLHVAVGVILNGKGQVLIALRNSKQHQGGLWEFPGGKVELGETCERALVRELDEELGILALNFEPLIRISHSYPDKSVILDVWTITTFAGEPIGKEGQAIKWVDILELSRFKFPEANIPIVTAIQLPGLVAITGPFSSSDDFLFRIDRAINRGAGLIQLRLPQNLLPLDSQLLVELKKVCKSQKVKIVVNSSLALEAYDTEVGLHLNSKDLMGLTERPVDASVLLGASCHNQSELQHAQAIGVDYAFLSPLNKTLSHEGAVPMGWQAFGELVEGMVIPVYALGGLSLGDVNEAKRFGAQGVAAIAALWGQ